MYNKKGVADLAALIILVLAIVSATFFVKDNLKGVVEAAQPTEPPPKLDLIPPRISFAPQAPPSGYFTNEKTLYFNWTYEERNLANITIYIKEEDTIIANKTTFYLPTYDFNYTPQNYNKMYSYSVNIIDLANEGNDTETRLITFDRVIPQINFESQTQPNNSYTNQNKIYLKWAFTEMNFANITIIISDSTSIANKTTFYLPTYDFTFYPVNLNTVYYYNVTIVDKATNSNSTETRNMGFDNTSPTISFTNRTPSNLSNTSSDLFFEVIASDTNIANITFNILNSTEVIYQVVYPIADGITSTIKSLNYPFLNEGVYYYNVIVTDKSNNNATTELREVDVDLKAPEVYLVIPNLTTVPNSKIALLFRVFDFLIANCTASMNSTLNLTSVSINISKGDIVPFNAMTFNNVENGNYFWNVSCTDQFNRKNTSITNQMVIRDSYKLLGTPVFFILPNYSILTHTALYPYNWPDTGRTLMSPGYTLMPNVTEIANATEAARITNTSPVWLHLFTSNSTFAQNCMIFINGTLNRLVNVDFWTAQSFDLTRGNYLINASCEDNLYNLTYWSLNYIVIVNYSKFIPNIISLTPSGTIITINSTAALTLQYQDVSASISNCTIVMNSTLNYTRSSYVGISNIIYNPFTITNLANGNYLWNVICTDTSNKKYYSYTYLLTVAVSGNAGTYPLTTSIINTISSTGGTGEGGGGGGSGGGSRIRGPITPTPEGQLPGILPAIPIGIDQSSEKTAATLEENSNIRAAVAEVTGSSSSSSFEEVAKNSEGVSKFISVSRAVESKTVSSVVINTEIRYSGKDFVEGFMVYDVIPKSVASNINEVTVLIPPKATYKIIEKDPKILIVFDNVTSGETNIISYLINKPLDETVINEFKTPTLFVKSIIEGVSKETKVEPKKGKYNWVWYIVGIVMLLVLIYLLKKKRNNKPNGNKLKKR